MLNIRNDLKLFVKRSRFEIVKGPKQFRKNWIQFIHYSVPQNNKRYAKIYDSTYLLSN